VHLTIKRGIVMAASAKRNWRGLGQRIMLAAGLIAASGFALVSIAANLRFGISLATTPFDRIIYGTLSVAVDLVKIALPLAVALLWRNGERMFALLGAVFWTGAVAFSICAAIGFAASTRNHMLGSGQQEIDKRRGWEAKIVRLEGSLDHLGPHRPATVVQAEIDSLLRTPDLDNCKVINGPVTREVCPKVDQLRRELVASKETARLEADLAAGHEALSDLPSLGITADPQSTALHQLTGFGEDVVRNTVAALIAVLVEFGSALGFSLFLAAAGPKAQCSGSSTSPPKAPIFRKQPEQAQAPLELPSPPVDLVTRWALARLDIISSGMLQAEHAYNDFRHWCTSQSVPALTQQMFGRRFTEVHAGMGGKKLKRQGRAFYSGVSLPGLSTSTVGPLGQTKMKNSVKCSRFYSDPHSCPVRLASDVPFRS
jgi:hypothetical protein